MGTMGEVAADFSQIHGTEEEWMEQQSSARLFERSRIKVLAGTFMSFCKPMYICDCYLSFYFSFLELS